MHQSSKLNISANCQCLIDDGNSLVDSNLLIILSRKSTHLPQIAVLTGLHVLMCLQRLCVWYRGQSHSRQQSHPHPARPCRMLHDSSRKRKAAPAAAAALWPAGCSIFARHRPFILPVRTPEHARCAQKVIEPYVGSRPIHLERSTSKLLRRYQSSERRSVRCVPAN